MAEEEPLIARSVAKRRNEFITVRYCARIALGELGFPPVPILKGEKGEPCWPDGVVGSLTHCAGYRGAVVGRGGAVRSVGVDAEPHDVLPDGVLDAISLPAERTRAGSPARRCALGPNPVLRQGSNVQSVVPADQALAGFRRRAHHVRRRRVGLGRRFESTILIDGATLSGPPLRSLAGRWSVDRDLVLTAIVL